MSDSFGNAAYVRYVDDGGPPGAYPAAQGLTREHKEWLKRHNGLGQHLEENFGLSLEGVSICRCLGFERDPGAKTYERDAVSFYSMLVSGRPISAQSLYELADGSHMPQGVTGLCERVAAAFLELSERFQLPKLPVALSCSSQVRRKGDVYPAFALIYTNEAYLASQCSFALDERIATHSSYGTGELFVGWCVGDLRKTAKERAMRLFHREVRAFNAKTLLCQSADMPEPPLGGNGDKSPSVLAWRELARSLVQILSVLLAPLIDYARDAGSALKRGSIIGLQDFAKRVTFALAISGTAYVVSLIAGVPIEFEWIKAVLTFWRTKLDE